MKATLCAAMLALMLPAAAAAEWAFAGFAGASHTTETWLSVDQPADRVDVTVAPVDYDGASFAPPIYYGYRAGFFPRSHWLGVEAEFIHLKVIADREQIASVLDHFSLTHGVNLILVNFVGRYPDEDAGSRFMFVGRVGAGGSVPHAESRLRADSREQYEWGGAALQGAIGAEMRIAGAFSLLGEYKLTRTEPEVGIVRGAARTSLVTHHLVFGVAVHLSRDGLRERHAPGAIDNTQ